MSEKEEACTAAPDPAPGNKITVIHTDADPDTAADAGGEQAGLKAQLDRIEAMLVQQDLQNRTLLRHSRIRFVITAVFAAALILCAVLVWVKLVPLYDQVLSACVQATNVAQTVQKTMDSLDTTSLNEILQELPQMMRSIGALDVDSLNAVMQKLPATMDAIATLQKQFASISTFFGGLAGG